MTEITVAEFGAENFEVENGVDFQREMRNFNQCDIDNDGRLSLVSGIYRISNTWKLDCEGFQSFANNF